MEETLSVGVLPGPVSNWRNNKPHPTGFGQSQYHEDFGKRKKYHQKGMQPRPTSSFRRNNPHPRPDFLLPKSMRDAGGNDESVQARLELAQRRYLDHLGYSQTDPPAKVLHNVLKASQKIDLVDPGEETVDEPARDVTPPAKGTVDFIQESLKLLEAAKKGDRGESKRERGNSYRDAAKGYATSPSPPKSGKPTTANSNRGRSPQLLNSSGENLMQSMKRAHPRTPPGTGSRRPHSVSYETQRVAEKKVNRLPHLYPRGDGKVETQLTNQQLTRPEAGDTDKVAVNGSRPVTAADFTAYSPRLKTWIDGANEYEKEVAYNLFKTLRSDHQMRRSSSLPRATGVYVPGPKLNTKEGLEVQKMMKLLDGDVERQYNISNRNGSPKFSETRPRARKTWKTPSFDGYVHMGSNFQPTRPPFMKSFDIAPDWCSEAKTYRRLVRRSAQNQGYKSV